MKKSTLISTLAMVVIVALALTTATFAWYTASTEVTATSTATAAVASSANLTIGGTVATATDTTYAIPCTSDEGATSILPAAPIADWSNTAPSITTSGTIGGDTAKLKTCNVDKDAKFLTGADFVSKPFTGTFAVVNAANAAATGKITMSLSEVVAADADASDVANMLRVAVFVGTDYVGTLCISDSAKETVYAMKEVVDEDATTDEENPVMKEVDGMVAGDASSTLKTYNATTSVDLTNSIESGDNIVVTFLAWFDGSMLTNPDNGKAVDFKFIIK